VRGVHDPPWCSEPSERRHVGVVRVVQDALWSEGTAREVWSCEACASGWLWGGWGRGKFVGVGHFLVLDICCRVDVVGRCKLFLRDTAIT
jgi:hypothetical protein